MDMSKYVKMYVSESQDRLQRMDGLLLTLEQGGAERGAIDTLFREAHSIKGMSASMGYEELAKVSHRMEDFLEQYRGGKGTLERGGVDLLFEGVDMLRRAVEEIAAGSAPSLKSDEYLAKMAVLILKAAPAAPAPAGVVAAEPAGRVSVPGRQQFAVDLRIAADAPLPSARAYITLRRVRDLGELIRSAPTVEQVQAGQFSGVLSMLVATAKSAAEVQAFLGSLPDVASVAVRPAGSEAPLDPRQAGPPRVRESSPAEAAPGRPAGSSAADLGAARALGSAASPGRGAFCLRSGGGVAPCGYHDARGYAPAGRSHGSGGRADDGQRVARRGEPGDRISAPP